MLCMGKVPPAFARLGLVYGSVQVSCLNEESQGSCKRVFKSWGERTNFTEDPLRSCEGDEELLLHIPYASKKFISFLFVHG